MHTRSTKDPGIEPKPSIRTITSRENGSLGGDARASRNDHVVLQEWSSRGGKKVLEKYGREYFVDLRRKREYYPSFWQSPITRRKMKSRTNAGNGRHGGDTRASLYSPEHFREWGSIGRQSDSGSARDRVLP
jgi:hypothetical protein